MLGGFLVWGLYPLWLLAGAGDYFSHRATRIEHTSGPTESWLHVAELGTIAVIFFCAVLLEITFAVLAIMVLALIAHTACSLIDVSYTIGRRHISSFEQLVHGFMNVIPIVAVCLLAIMHWETLASAPMLRWKDQPLSSPQIAWLLGSFIVLAGTPVLEELIRTRHTLTRSSEQDAVLTSAMSK